MFQALWYGTGQGEGDAVTVTVLYADLPSGCVPAALLKAPGSLLSSQTVHWNSLFNCPLK